MDGVGDVNGDDDVWYDDGDGCGGDGGVMVMVMAIRSWGTA